ncbi:conserved hypothetical protein [Nostocoides australiense Ben110]|uniref:Activator of Hsp90 ATPase homologue 1/2-like C-terminal domain-containing protein n=2 Tax=Nostocoides australiense TaxID=99480 RepID=W6K3C4_9MICO|nr:conserved hypothetical protein [Tetrasphaera australiensis Ben110]
MTMDTVSEAPAEKADAVRVSRVLNHPVTSVWGALMAPHGAEALLGEGGELGSKGESWHAADGTYGVTRSFHPMEQIRFSWHADADAPATLVDVHLRPEGEQTDLEIVHDHLDEAADRDWLAAHWESALDRLDSMSI